MQVGVRTDEFERGRIGTTQSRVNGRAIQVEGSERGREGRSTFGKGPIQEGSEEKRARERGLARVPHREKTRSRNELPTAKADTEDAMTTKTALAYVSDVILGRTGEVLTREEQKKAILAHAAANGINVIEIFEDDAYNEEILARPGIQKLLACKHGYDCVLVERVWSLSRNLKSLKGFYAKLEEKKAKLEAATTLWDVASQATRHYFAGRKSLAAPAEKAAQAGMPGYKIAKPSRVHFGTTDR